MRIPGSDPAATAIRQLRGHPSLRGLSTEAIVRLAADAEVRDVPAGEVLVDPSSDDSDAYVILDGTADAMTDGRFLGLLSPGDVVGCNSTLALTRTCTAVSRSGVRVLVIPRGVWDRFVDADRQRLGV